MNVYQVFFVDQIGLSVEKEERSPALPLTEEHIPTSGRAVKGSTQNLEKNNKMYSDILRI